MSRYTTLIRTLSATGLFVAAVLLWPLSAWAEEEKIVEAIEVITRTGETSPLQALVVDQMTTKVGQPLSTTRINDDLRRIYNLEQYGEKQFDDIEILFRDLPPIGVKLYVRVLPRVKIEAVKFWGRKNLDESALLEAISQKPPRLLARSQVTRDAKAVEAAYQKEGYQFVQVTYLDQPELLDQGVIVYQIEEGPQVTIDEIRFRGNHSFTQGELKGKMFQTKESNILVSGHFSEKVYEEDLRNVGRFYRSEGFLGAVVETESLEHTEDKSLMNIFVHVTEGERYKIGSVTFHGNRYFSEVELAGRLTLRTGEPFSGAKFQADQQTIRDLYGRDAFIDLTIGQGNSGPEISFALEEPVIDIIYNLVEGQQVFVGTVQIIGNLHTRDRVIRNALTFHPGERFNLSALDKSKSRLVQTGFFETVDVTITPRTETTRRVNDIMVTVREADAVIQVKEKETYGSFNIGGAVSSDRGLLAFISFTRENFDIADPPKDWDDFIQGNAFLGGGQRMNLTLSPGAEVSTYSMNFSDPYFFGSRYAFGTNLFFFNREREDFDEDRGGSDFTLTKRLTEDLSLGFGLRLVSVDISSFDTGVPPDVVKEKGTNFIGAPRISLTKDTRRYQNFVLIYDGMDASIGLEMVSKAFASDYEFVKISPGINHYRTLWIDDAGLRHILKTSFSYSVAQEFSGDVPFFERYYAGGTNLRGFEFRGAGPQQLGEPVGAQSMLLSSFEYNFPVMGDALRGVTFLDMGSIDKDPFAVGDTRASFGFGLRLFVPQFPIPIAVDLAFPFIKEDDDDTEILNFSLGGRF